CPGPRPKPPITICRVARATPRRHMDHPHARDRATVTVPPPHPRHVQSALREPTLQAAEASRYGLVAQTPALDPKEFDAETQALEVLVMWGDDVLHVEVLGVERSFVLGRDFVADHAQ